MTERIGSFSMNQSPARVVKLVDTRDLKSLAFNGVPVRFRPRAPSTSNQLFYLDAVNRFIALWFKLMASEAVFSRRLS